MNGSKSLHGAHGSFKGQISYAMRERKLRFPFPKCMRCSPAIDSRLSFLRTAFTCGVLWQTISSDGSDRRIRGQEFLS